MIRGAALRSLTRWRDLLVALPVVCVGVMGLLHYSYLYKILGGICIIIGLMLVRTGVQRARLRGAAPAAGVVHLDEGQVTYLAPFGGGAVALDTIMVITYLPGAHPYWRLTTAMGEALSIPTGAHNSDLLLDAFAALPGFRSDRMIAALRAPDTDVITIWRRANAVIDTTRISPQG